MLGDSVVDVKHCIDPKSGKISPTTWAVLAAGLVCLVASAIAFGASVSAAAFNKGGLDYWVHVAHKPAFAYRPELLGQSYDWLALGGLVAGLVAAVLGLGRMRDERKSPYYRIGTAPGVEQPLDSAPAPSFPLVAPRGDDFVFNYAPGIDGELVVDGKTTPLAELAATGLARPSLQTAGAIEVPIPARAKIRARSGMTTFVVMFVAGTNPILLGLLAVIGSSVIFVGATHARMERLIAFTNLERYKEGGAAYAGGGGGAKPAPAQAAPARAPGAKADFSLVKEGMSMEEVFSTIGEPTATTSRMTGEWAAIAPQRR